jgi:hypothetical protein
LAPAVDQVVQAFPDFPFLPELPARGPGTDMVARALGLIDQLAFEDGPFGWRTAAHPSREQRRARARLGDDLELAAERLEGRSGDWHVSLTGPWTLSALVGRGSGELLLADAGACRDLAQAWLEAVANWCDRIQRLIPGVRLSLQVDEPMLPMVAVGAVGTASGWRRHRPVPPDRLVEGYAGLSDWAERTGLAQTVLHCCAPGLNCGDLGRAGFSAVSCDLANLGGDDDGLAQFYEAGGSLWLGAVPTDQPDRRVSLDQIRPGVLALLDRLGIDPAQGRLWLTPACGLAGFKLTEALATARLLADLAQAVDEAGAD